MNKKLRKQAEAFLKMNSEETPVVSTADLKNLVHELQVHQVELEMQNEELRQTQIELAHSRDMYAELYDFAPVAYLTLDAEGRITGANLTAATLFGVERAKLIHRKFTEFVQHDSQDDWFRHHRTQLEIEKKQSLDLEMHKADGSPFIANLESGPLPSVTGGAGANYLVALMDVTRTRRTVKALQKTSDQLKRRTRELDAVLSSVRDCIYIFDPEGRFTFANKAVLDIWRFSSEQAVGKTMRELNYPEEVETILESGLRRVFETGKTVQNVTHYTSPAGVSGAYENLLSPIFDASGKVAFVAGCSRDITEREQTRLTLQKLAQQRRIALNAARMGWWHYDPVTRIASWDDRYKEIFGVSESQVPDQEILTRFIHPEDRSAALAQARAALNPDDPQPFSTECRIVRPDGETRWIEAHGMASFEGAGRDRHAASFVGTVADITERKQAEEALRESEEKARWVARFPEENPSPVLRTSSDGIVLYRNPAVANWKDWECEVGQPLKQEPLRGLLEEAFRKGEPAEGEIELGGRVLAMTASPILTEDYANFYGKDITARKNAEEALRRSEERYRTLFDTMSEGFSLHEIITDKKGRPCDYRFLDANPAFERLTGLDRDDLIGRAVSEVLPGTEPHWIENFGKVALTGKPAHFENFSAELGRWYEVYAYRTAPRQFAVIFSDVTERKLAREAAEEGKRLLDALMDHVPEGITITDAAGNLRLVSRYGEELLGGAHAGKSIAEVADQWKVYRPDGVTPMAPEELPLTRATRKGEVVRDAELIQVNARGKKLPLLCNAAPIRDSAGEIVGGIAVWRDIGERKRAEEKLRKEHHESELANRILSIFMEEEGDDLFEKALDVALEATGSRLGMFCYISGLGNLICPSLTKTLPECKVEGKGIPFLREEWKGLTSRALREKRPFFSNEAATVPPGHLPIRNNLAVPILFQDKAIGLLNLANRDGGYSEEVLSLTENIASRIAPALYGWILEDERETERMIAEQELRRSREDLDRAQMVGQIGSWRLDTRSNNLAWSDENYRIFGIAPGAPLAYETFLEAVHPDDREYVDAGWQAALRGEPYDIQHRIVAEGRTKWVREKAYLDFDEEGQLKGGFGITQDITELKLAEQLLEELNETLEQRVAERTSKVQEQADWLRALASELSRVEQRERKRLARILHDHIQQLIVAARMQLAWMIQDDEPERLQSAAQGADAILSEALEASRSLTVDLSPPVLHETGLVGGLHWLAARMQEKNRFTVNLLSDSKAEPATEEMRFLLFECVRELLFNAVKHAGVFEAQVNLLRTEDDQIRLIVSDEGKGFDPDVLNRRGSDELTYGLFSIQERLAHLGGRMEVEAAPGKGNRITLTVPAGEPEQSAEEELVAKAREDLARSLPMRRKTDICRVLIVDDHKIMREGLATLLRFERGIEVVGEAADSAQAIELANGLSPDVVIMDVNLGDGQNGVEATRRILADNPDIRIIGLSMHTDKDVAKAMRDAGAVAYLQKGGPSQDLIAAIRSCCGIGACGAKGDSPSSGDSKKADAGPAKKPARRRKKPNNDGKKKP